MTSSLDPAQLESAKALLLERLAPEIVVLFGSAATGRGFGPDSDIDLGFLCQRSPGKYDCFMLAQELAGILGRDVDLVDLGQASTVFKKEILAGSKFLYESDPIRAMDWRMRALKEYAKLNEERAPVLKARFKQNG